MFRPWPKAQPVQTGTEKRLTTNPDHNQNGLSPIRLDTHAHGLPARRVFPTARTYLTSEGPLVRSPSSPTTENAKRRKGSSAAERLSELPLIVYCVSPTIFGQAAAEVHDLVGPALPGGEFGEALEEGPSRLKHWDHVDCVQVPSDLFTVSFRPVHFIDHFTDPLSPWQQTGDARSVDNGEGFLHSRSVGRLRHGIIDITPFRCRVKIQQKRGGIHFPLPATPQVSDGAPVAAGSGS